MMSDGPCNNASALACAQCGLLMTGVSWQRDGKELCYDCYAAAPVAGAQPEAMFDTPFDHLTPEELETVISAADSHLNGADLPASALTDFARAILQLRQRAGAQEAVDLNASGVYTMSEVQRLRATVAAQAEEIERLKWELRVRDARR